MYRLWQNYSGQLAYKSWWQMHDRCYNPDAINFDRYGARGISVCERWRDNFDTFMEDMGPRSKGATIERIDNDRGYEPGNCRWATRKEQARNRHNARLIAYAAVVKSAAQWAEDLGVNLYTFLSRVRRHGTSPTIAHYLARMEF